MKRKALATAATAAIASLSLATAASAAEVSITPAEVDFGAVPIGSTSAPKTVTLEVPCLYVLDLGQHGGRTCTAPGVIDAVTTTGDFAQTNNCVLPIVNASTTGDVVSCQVSVTFTPSAVGTRAGKLDFAAYSAPDAYSVPLAGTGVTTSSPPGGRDPIGTDPKGGGAAGSAGTALGKKCKQVKRPKARKKCKKPRRRLPR